MGVCFAGDAAWVGVYASPLACQATVQLHARSADANGREALRGFCLLHGFMFYYVVGSVSLCGDGCYQLEEGVAWHELFWMTSTHNDRV